MVIVSLMDYSFILRFTWLYYIGIIVLLGLVMTGIGDSAGGAQRWIDFGGFRFQPSELAKIVLILFFARFFSKHAENLNTVKNHRSFFCPDRNSSAFDCKAAGYFNFHRNCINFY